jgi:REP element-mobilizing transposase RayT
MRSRGYLPHIENAAMTQHIVFRVAGALPRAVLENASLDEDERFREIEAALDTRVGPLADPLVADIVATQLVSGNGYKLSAWCVMPSHVHVLAHVTAKGDLGRIVRAWKGASARLINLARGEAGQFWAREWYDRYMRNDAQFWTTKAYIERNPVVAGLCDAPEDWRWSSAWRVVLRD